jgi:hypothetical protein
MVLLIMALAFSCSWAFGYAMQHPGVSYLYPTLYTIAVVIALAVPCLWEFFSLRVWHDKPRRGLGHSH